MKYYVFNSFVWIAHYDKGNNKESKMKIYLFRRSTFLRT